MAYELILRIVDFYQNASQILYKQSLHAKADTEDDTRGALLASMLSAATEAVHLRSLETGTAFIQQRPLD